MGKKYFLFLIVSFFITFPLLAKIGDEEWARQQVEIYPELAWLAQEKVRGTQEGISSVQPIKLSQALYGKTYDEFDRTLHTLKDLELFLEGTKEAYEEFIQGQPVKGQLTFKSLQEVGEAARSLIKKNPEYYEAMKISLIFGDMGKTEQARGLAKQHGIEEADHDHFLQQVLLKCPEIFPSYTKLSSFVRGILKKEFPLHVGHFTHLEGGSEILTPLKQLGLVKNELETVDFFLFVHTCDVAGALAHVNPRGSLTYTENTHKTFQALQEALKLLATNDESTALKYYLTKRAQWLGLNAEDENDQVLTRLGAMLRYYSQDEGKILQKAFSKVDKDNRDLIRQQFNPLTVRSGRTPTYIPAVLLNLKNNSKCGETEEERLFFVFQQGLPFILNVLRVEAEKSKKVSSLTSLTLCFNALAKQAKENPWLLKTKTYLISPEGDVQAAEEKK